MNEIFSARNEFAAYLMSSALDARCKKGNTPVDERMVALVKHLVRSRVRDTDNNAVRL